MSVVLFYKLHDKITMFLCTKSRKLYLMYKKVKARNLLQSKSHFNDIFHNYIRIKTHNKKRYNFSDKIF